MMFLPLSLSLFPSRLPSAIVTPASDKGTNRCGGGGRSVGRASLRLAASAAAALSSLLLAASLPTTTEAFLAPGPPTRSLRSSASAVVPAMAALTSPTSASSEGGASDRTSAAPDGRMARTYDELASRLVDRHAREASTLRNGQLFACVAGGPGSGKSTLAEAVVRRINERMAREREADGGGGGCGDDARPPAPAAVVLPMDGFHHARAKLKSMGASSDCPRSYEDLLARRGAPWTFDAEACVAAFAEARRTGRATLPTYSRTKSDPVPGGATLHPETKIVLLEGNYLLAWDDPRWSPLRDLEVFDETWYVSCASKEAVRERLVRRHLETWSDEKTRMFGGDGIEGAGRKADSNDMLNWEWIEETSRKHADLIVESL
ncbi:hypothetical protein ACHAWF_017600 [Thalassiosira exigua]